MVDLEASILVGTESLMKEFSY